jgi:hypothetical protein
MTVSLLTGPAVCLQAGLPQSAVVAAHGNFDSEWRCVLALAKPTRNTRPTINLMSAA